jgi:hypothetical protein
VDGLETLDNILSPPENHWPYILSYSTITGAAKAHHSRGLMSLSAMGGKPSTKSMDDIHGAKK